MTRSESSSRRPTISRHEAAPREQAAAAHGRDQEGSRRRWWDFRQRRLSSNRIAMALWPIASSCQGGHRKAFALFSQLQLTRIEQAGKPYKICRGTLAVGAGTSEQS